jgi:hypothetical protein
MEYSSFTFKQVDTPYSFTMIVSIDFPLLEGRDQLICK